MSIKPYKWTLLAVAVAVFAGYQLRYQTRIVSDPGSFIPSASNERQKILLQELKQGSAGRLWLIAIHNESPDVLAGQNRQLADELGKSGVFDTVLNGGHQVDEAAMARVNKYRFLLVEEPGFSVAELHESLLQRLQDLHSPLSTFSKEMISSDPTGRLIELQNIFSKQSGASGLYRGVWFSQDRKLTFLVAESRAAGLDLDAQEKILKAVIERFGQIRGKSKSVLVTSGAPAIALATRDRIQRDSRKFSLVASLIVLVILLVAYRRIAVTLFSAIPLAFSLLLASAVVSFVFGNIHGITLAFGVTLLGIALDYPVHLLSHRGQGENLSQAAKKIWPVMRLGAMTTGLGYLSMLFSGFEGLVQLGVFSVTGIAVALLVTRFQLPELDRFVSGAHAWKPPFLQQSMLIRVPGGKFVALILAGACVVLLAGNTKPILSDDLSELSPIPVGLASQDRRLREELGVSEPRYVVFVKGRGVEQVLQAQERLVPLLQAMTAAGDIVSFEAASQMLPSIARQKQRQGNLPDKKALTAQLEQAMKGTPFRPGTFDRFLRDVETSRTMNPLLMENLSGTAIGLSLESVLHQRQGYALGVVRLGGVNNLQRLSVAIDRIGDENVWFVDLKQATGHHVRDFSRGMVKSVALAFGVIFLVLAISLRDTRRVRTVLLPVAASVLVAATIPVVLGGSLNLFHLVSLLLVAGLGVDYALFFSQRWQNDDDRLGTLHSMVVCSLSTIGVFATLSFSEVPVLHSIGITVAVGALSSFLLSWISSRKII